MSKKTKTAICSEWSNNKIVRWQKCPNGHFSARNFSIAKIGPELLGWQFLLCPLSPQISVQPFFCSAEKWPFGHFENGHFCFGHFDSKPQIDTLANLVYQKLVKNCHPGNFWPIFDMSKNFWLKNGRLDIFAIGPSCDWTILKIDIFSGSF